MPDAGSGQSVSVVRDGDLAQVADPLRASSGDRAGIPGDTDHANLVPLIAKCLTRTSAGGTSSDLETSDFVPEPIAFCCKDYGADAVRGIAPTMRAMGHANSHANAGGQLAVAFNAHEDPLVYGDFTGPLTAQTCQPMAVAVSGRGSAVPSIGWRVRRFTTTECARLQGFPDDHTLIPWRGRDAADCPDGPQYKAYGNSMAVRVMAWLGQRLAAADAGLPRRRVSG